MRVCIQLEYKQISTLNTFYSGTANQDIETNLKGKVRRNKKKRKPTRSTTGTLGRTPRAQAQPRVRQRPQVPRAVSCAPCTAKNPQPPKRVQLAKGGSNSNPGQFAISARRVEYWSPISAASLRARRTALVLVALEPPRRSISLCLLLAPALLGAAWSCAPRGR